MDPDQLKEFEDILDDVIVASILVKKYSKALIDLLNAPSEGPSAGYRQFGEAKMSLRRVPDELDANLYTLQVDYK
jgi:hypothetical protein